MIFEYMFQNMSNAEDVALTPDNAQFLGDGRKSADMFTSAVASLMNSVIIPNPKINALAQMIWNLVGNKIVLVAAADNHASMHFYFEKMGDRETAMIILPVKWHNMVMDEPVMQGGAVIFNGSRAQDVYNKRLPSQQRASAYEAEYLLTCIQLIGKMPGAKWVPNEYQQKVLKDFPQGLDSLKPENRYEPKPFEG